MPEPRLCCGSCFGDRFLRRHIAALATGHGNCSYCGTRTVALVDPTALADKFGLLINIYQHDSNGKFLVEWFKEDWKLFHAGLDVARCKELLADVLDDGDIVRQRFSPSSRYPSDRLNKWQQLRDELMYKNRYFPTAQLDLDRLEELLSQLIADRVPDQWFRARLQTTDIAFKIDEMNAPPKRLAAHGRANPAGIPYLYLGSTPETAVAEVRPHTGELACVADFTLQPDLKIIDLRDPRQLMSPFVLAVEDHIGLLRSDIEFLERLGQELTTPIVPQGAPIDYVPSQYLCEFIKNCDYDGVVYSSSVSDGMNLALFSPDNARPGAVQQYSVAKVSVAVAVKT
jgi:RES domain-containing protein